MPTATATSPKPRHSFRLYDDGSALVLSGRTGNEYAVSEKDCTCDRCQKFGRGSCSHRDQLADMARALEIISEANGYAVVIAPLMYADLPCRRCGSDRTVHVLCWTANGRGGREWLWTGDVCAACGHMAHDAVKMWGRG